MVVKSVHIAEAELRGAVSPHPQPTYHTLPLWAQCKLVLDWNILDVVVLPSHSLGSSGSWPNDTDEAVGRHPVRSGG